MKTNVYHLRSRLAWSPWIIAFLLVSSILGRGIAAEKTWDGGGLNNFWQTGANWNADTPPSAGDSLIFAGTIDSTTTNNFPVGTLFNGLSFNSPAGAFTLSGNLITLGGDIVNNQVVTVQSINLPLALNATRNVGVVADGFLTIGGAISGAGIGLTKTGDGRLTLTASNTFSGPVTVDAGTLSIASDANLGATPAATEPGRIVLNGGALRATSSVTLNPNRGLALGPATGSGAGIFNVGEGITLTYRGVIANNGGTGGLTKTSFGALTLSGANSYTGPTMIKNGTITLDYAQATSAAVNIISSSSALSLGGANAGLGDTSYAELVMSVGATNVNSQAFNGTTIDIGPARIQAGSAATMALGALSHVTGGIVNLVVPAATGGTGRITTTTTNTQGILGGWASVGDGTILNGLSTANGWASVDASGNIVAYTGYQDFVTDQVLDGTTTPATNLRNTSSSTGPVRVAAQNAGVTVDINTLQLADPAGSIPASAVPDLTGRNVVIGAGNTLRLGKYGAIMRNVTSSSVTWEIDASEELLTQGQATLTAGGAPDTDGELLFNIFSASESSGSLNVDVTIADNGTGKVTVVKAGRSSMKFRGHNTYSGGTYILQGRFQLAGSEQGGTANPDGWGTGPLYIFPGGQAFPSGISGTTPFTNAIFMAGIGTDAENTGAIRLGGGSLYTGTITLIGDARLGGGGANNAVGGGATISGQITGPFSLDVGSTANVGGGATVVILSSSNNDWTGNTTILGRTGGTSGHGRLVLGTNDVIPNGFGKGNVIVGLPGVTASTSTLDLNGFNETINGLSTEGAGNPAGLFVENNSATPSTLTVGDNDQSATFAGLIRDGTGAIGALGLGPVNLTKIGGGIQTLTGANTYSGKTWVNGGTLAVIGAGSVASSLEILVDNGATLDVSAVTGGFSFANTLGMNNGALIIGATTGSGINNFSLTNSRVRVTTLSSATPNVLTTSLSTSGQTNLIDIISVGAIERYPAQFPIIKYTGSIGGAGFNFALGDVPSPSTRGFISNNIANSSVDLYLFDGPKPLTWTGTASGDWDIDTTTNWLAFGVTPIAYLNADSVRFDDTSTRNIVNLTTTLKPGAVTVSNQIVNYVFTGSGNLSGFGNLTKDGAGTLTMANSGINDFTGGITVNAGTLQVGTNGTSGNLPAGSLVNNGALVFSQSDDLVVRSDISGTGSLTKKGDGVLTLSGVNTYDGQTIVAQGTLKAGNAAALGSGVGNTTVNNGATLDVNGLAINAVPVTVSGAGVGGQGAIINTGVANINALRNVTLVGDTTFGGTERWDIRNTDGTASLITGGSPYRLTKVGTNQVSLVGVEVDAALADINVQQGMFSVETSTTSLGNPANRLTLASGATLQLYNNTVPLEKVFVLNGDGVTTTVNNNTGANTINGPITLTGSCIFNAGGTSLTLSGAVGGSGGLTKLGSSEVILAGTANYSGSTLVNSGTLTVNGSLANSSSSMTVNGGILAGYGVIAGPVTVASNGTLSPGDAVTFVSSITLNNTLNLSGAVVMDVIKSGGVMVGDQILGVSQLTLGGTLRINVDTNNEVLAVGDAIKLFGFTSASGAFATISPAPGEGLDWDASNLTKDGTLKVRVKQSTAAQPRMNSPTMSGTNLVLSGTGGTPNTTYLLLTSTNVTWPTANWTLIGSIPFDASGNFTYTLAVDKSEPQRFFLIEWK
jgi:autotransporter-associated beta strand protein